MRIKLWASKLILILTTLMWPGLILAQSYSIATQIEGGSNLYAEKQYERSATQSLTLTPAMDLSKNWKAASRIQVVKETVAPGRTQLANTPLSAIYSGYLLGPLEVQDKILAVLPTNQESIESEKYRGSLGLGTALILNKSKKVLPVTAALDFSISRNSHQFTQNAEGNPNIQNSLRTGLSLDCELTRRLGLSFLAAYRTAYTYDSSVRNNFIAGTSLGYDINKNLNIYAGTSTGERAAFKSNGSDSNITLFDDTHSEVFAGLTYNI